jgi:hypothetical protein
LTADDNEIWRKALRRRLESMPDDYASAKAIAAEISHAFHEELAVAIGPRIKAELSAMPQESYEHSKAIASWCNHELHELRLCIRCPRTGRAAILLADTRGADDDTCRYRLQVRDDQGKTLRTYSSARFPEFDIMEDLPRREGISHWSRGGRRR